MSLTTNLLELFHIYNSEQAFVLCIEIDLRAWVDLNLILDPYSVISSRSLNILLFYCNTNFIMAKEHMNDQLKGN